MTTEKIQSEYNIPLGNGKYAMIDLCDLDKIEGWTFKHNRRRGRSRGYADGYAGYKNGKRVLRRLHQIIMGEPPPGFEIAHLDSDGLNCHRSNLEFQTRAQNARGPRAKGPNATSKYRGVARYRKTRWQVGIWVDNTRQRVGEFDCEEDAARAYDSAARKHYGEYAACNFSLEEAK